MPQIDRQAESTLCPSTSLANIASQPPTEPCEFCQVVLRHYNKGRRTLLGIISTEYERFDHYPDFPALQSTAEAGCGVCWLIIEAIQRAWPVRSAEDWTGEVKLYKFTYYKKTHGSEWNSYLELKFEPAIPDNLKVAKPTFEHLDSGTGSWPRRVYFGFYEKLGQKWQYDKAAVENVLLPSPQTLSTANIKMMSSWLKACADNHEVCSMNGLPSEADPQLFGGRGLDHAWLPTRLLTVGIEGDQTIRLLETRKLQNNQLLPDNASSMKYAALSHMWGNVAKVKPLRTLRENYSQKLEAIGWHELPQTFADAITVCRALKIGYIWIDSLCIVQDDGDDWATEAKTMDKVYTWAFLTIVSASATSSADGFLARDVDLIPATKISLDLDAGDKPGFFVLTPLEKPGANFGKTNVEGAPWNTRGWTMQERYLSTRLIYFCRNKIYMECLTSQFSEYHRQNDSGGGNQDWGRAERPARAKGFELAKIKVIMQEGKPVRLSTHGTPGVFELEHSQEFVKAATGHERTMMLEFPIWLNHWLGIVTAYSARELTYGTDKLVAIQGIASKLSPHLYDSYVAWAGIWTHGYLPQQLLWLVPKAEKTNRLDNGSPTWSWAGLHGRVEFDWEYYQIRHPDFVNYDPKISIIDPDTLHIKALAREAMLGSVGMVDQRASSGERDSFRLWDIDAPDAPAIFAHVLMDVNDSENYHNTWTRVVYVHLWTDPSTSGLVIQAVIEEDQITHWKRIGSANIFDRNTIHMDEPSILQPGAYSRYEVQEIIIK